VYGVFLLNSISLLFRRIFLGSTDIHSEEESKNEYLAGFSFGGKHDNKSATGVFPFGKDMTVNPWRVLRDCIGFMRHGFFLSRRFRWREHNNKSVGGLVFFPEGGRGMDRGMEIRRYGDGG